MLRLTKYAAIFWMAMHCPVLASSEDMNNDPHRSLLAQRINSYDQYVASQINESSLSKVVKASSSGAIAVTSTSFMYFLGRDLSDNLIGISGPGYAVGIVAQAPVAFIVFDLTLKKLNQVLRHFNPHWRDIRKSTPMMWAKEITYETVGHGISFFPGMIGIYYTNQYWRPLISNGVWALIVPTAVGQCILGQGALDALYRYALSFSQAYIFKSCLSDETLTRMRVEGLIDNFITEVKGYSAEEVQDFLSEIRGSRYSHLLHASPVTIETLGQKIARNSMGISGSIVGLVGSFATIAATKTGVKWLLTAGLGVNTDTADSVATVSGYFGGFTVGAIRGLGARNTFQTLYSYFSRCCNPRAASMSKKQITTDSIAGGLSVISSSSRIKIILDTNIQEPALKVIVIAASIAATSSTDFYGLKGVIDEIFHGSGEKQSIIKLLNGMKADLYQLKPSLVAEIEIAMSRPKVINEVLVNDDI
ncbi:MAG: hypothetical protein KBB83_05385 [Alphaproteobacteria bacterium]|nr:hypothetical protein [Alphaproteobacteria bacterium]